MKHKSWIQDYENNFEGLAEEIGNLRYDTLAEFLEFLGKKLEEDAQKDASRGRKKLANYLQNSSNELLKSSKNIKDAWRICAPYMFPQDILQKIKIEFIGKKKIQEVLQLLLDYYRDWDEDETFRLARCLLFETNGSIEKLKEHIKWPNGNLIIHAEYDDKMNWLRNFNRPFGKEAITQEDLDYDKLEFTDSDGDNLPF